jgi:predicted PurR-regulated permease PerM
MAPPGPLSAARDAAASATQADRAFVARAARIGILSAVTAAALLAAFFVLKAALTPLAAAFLLAYLVDPLIDRAEALGIGRRTAILLVLAPLGLAVLGFLLVVIPGLAREVADLAQRMPGYLERLATEGVPALESRLGIQLPHTLDEVLAGLRGAEATLLGRLGELLRTSIVTLTGTLSALVGLLVIPVLAYYMLAEFDQLLARAEEWVPPRYRDYVRDKVEVTDRLISGFVRGQLLVAGVLALLYSVGFAVIGVDLALGVGLLAGVCALVPYLGSAVAVLASSVLCLLEFGLDWHLGAVLGWYVAVQNFEGFVLTPRVMGGSVGLHPALVIVALLIGGDLFGFLGLLVAVPAAAVLKVFVEEILEVYRRSWLFREAEPPDPERG